MTQCVILDPYPPGGLLTHDGVLDTDVEHGKIPYHIAVLCHRDVPHVRESRKIAMMSCRVTCMCFDLIRGRQVASALRRMTTSVCLKRLETMAYVVTSRLDIDEGLRAQLQHLPAIPHGVNGTVVNVRTFEMVVFMTIGELHYVASLVFNYHGSRWICAKADIG